MTLRDLEPGIYALAEDVKNPHPDRRFKHDWKLKEKVESGTMFKIVQHKQEADDGVPAHIEVYLVPTGLFFGTRGVRLGRIYADGVEKSDKGWAPHRVAFAWSIIEKLSPCERDFDSVYLENNDNLYQDDGCRAILKYLVQSQHVTLDEIEDLFKKAGDGSLYDIIGEPYE